MKKLFALFAIFLILTLSACDSNNINSNTISGNIVDFTHTTLPSKIALLSNLNLDTIDTFEKYKAFADNMNALIIILNEQNDLFNIPPIPATQDAWSKASKAINEYGPLINNYNEVVSSAKAYELVNTTDNLKNFYTASGKFAFETALIVGVVFYTVTFNIVGTVYRAIGLNRLALACGACAGVILSNAHWTIRAALVEGSSQLAQKILDEVSGMYNNLGGSEGVKEKATSTIESSKNYMNRLKDKFLTKT